MPSLRLGILTALWRRPALTAAVLDYYRHLTVPGVKLTRLAVKSPEDPEPVSGTERCQWDGAWHYVTAPNAPLSDKWNAGMEAMQAHGLDAVMIVGSDDLVHPSYITAAAQAIRAGAGLVRAEEIAFLDVTGDTLRACLSRPRRLGAGRTLSAALLDRVGWRPWPSGLSRKLDGGMDRNLRKTPYRDVPVAPGAVPQFVGVKAGVNLWTYDSLAQWQHRAYTPDEAQALLTDHFPSFSYDHG